MTSPTEPQRTDALTEPAPAAAVAAAPSPDADAAVQRSPLLAELRGILDGFLEEAVVERSLSKNTVAAYARDLEDFLRWVQQRDLAPRQLQTADLDAYTSAMGRRGLCESSIARKLSAIRQLIRFLERE